MPLIHMYSLAFDPGSRLNFASAGGFAICDLRCAFPASAGIAARPSCPRRAWFDAQPSTCSSSSARGCAAPEPSNLGALTGGVSASGACTRAALRCIALHCAAWHSHGIGIELHWKQQLLANMLYEYRPKFLIYRFA